MADGFIVRKGGVTTEQALAPTITEVSTTTTSITFTIKNNDTSTAVILWELDDATPDANSFELAADTTSSSITVSDLTIGTEYDVYATANVTGKVKSNVTELAIETDNIIYTAATGGTTAEYDDSGKRYKSHTFLSDGTFTVTTVGNGDRNAVDYLIIAGGGSGGGGGANQAGGGGGAGGYRTTLGTSGGDTTARDKVVVTAQAYSIDVGSGGSISNGNPSSALGIDTVGGGQGGVGGAGSIGGSGGGGGSTGGGSAGAAGTSFEGFAGGDGEDGASIRLGGGGGGAGVVGANATTSNGGNGGNGLANLLRTGSNETRGGGGGGGVDTGGSTTRGNGGSGGGANGSGTSSTAPAGTANTGGGGGGGAIQLNISGYNPGNGGSGIVVIRYEIAPSV